MQRRETDPSCGRPGDLVVWSTWRFTRSVSASVVGRASWHPAVVLRDQRRPESIRATLAVRAGTDPRLRLSHPSSALPKCR
jgi:hypothetical protein